MNEDLEIIKTLRFSPVTSRKADEEEATQMVKKYFRADTEDRFSLLTKTYQSGMSLSKEEWNLNVAEHFSESKPKIKIRSVGVISGCMVGVLAELRFEETGEMRFKALPITLVREKNAYEPDPDSPLGIDGKTVPPYIWGVKKR